MTKASGRGGKTGRPRTFLESEHRPASTTTSTSSLTLSDVAEVRHAPELERSREAIDPEIRGKIARVVRGGTPWPLVLLGTAGLGKTCAALCLADTVAGATRYHSIAELAERVRQAQLGQLESEQGFAISVTGVWGLWHRAVLTVLDELGGRQAVSDARYEIVKRAIDERHGQPAVFISNLDMAALAEVYDDRVTSRLAGGTVIVFGGGDRRLVKGGG